MSGFDARGCIELTAPVSRRVALKAGAVALAGSALPARAAGRRRPPNFIIVLCDDLGYGDLQTFGGRLIATPNIDRMAAEGLKLTHYFAPANLCTPSRAGLLTGRYPIRTGLAYEVIQAKDTNGLPLSEVTIASALKPDYATAMIGKWHLGHVAPYWPPTRHGFDSFYGIPYSHDMKPLAMFEQPRPDAALISGPVDFPRLTEYFFERGLSFIDAHRDRPLFLYLALTAPHAPLIPNPDGAGHSRAAAYGDVVEEVDRSMARLFDRLRTLGIDDNTLVIFTSDNGPWFEGSSGGLRDRKGGAGFEGGYRVPFIARWPGVVPRGATSDALIMGIDLLPTLVSLAGKPVPPVSLDGRDMGGLLRTGTGSPHDELILFNNERVAAVRTARWKLVVRSYYRTLDLPIAKFGYPLLFDMVEDPAENYNMAQLHPDVMADMQARVARAQATYEPLGVRHAPDKLPQL